MGQEEAAWIRIRKRSLTALDDFDSSKHSGVIAYFNQNYVKTGIFDKGTSKIIKSASIMREQSD